MTEDRSLLGSGPYPDSGLLAIGARLALVGAAAAIAIAVYLPPWMIPDFVRSKYLQHFAAFYVLALAALAAMPRRRMRRVVFYLALFATGLETTHLFGGAALHPLIRNWVADLGGISAAMAPVIVERFRRRFPSKAG
jgi:hypothetical protein